jgi:YYY domain-containing protein
MKDILAVLSWWLLIEVIGLAAWPLAFRLLRWLPDRGYTAAKPLGLLLTSYALWLAGSLGLMQNSLGGILFALILVLAASAWALSRDGIAALRDWLAQHRAMVLVYEALFLVAMCGWAAFRATNPGINSTEKPMEFMFLNSILRSPSFPPHDAWLSGFGISYYYFGYVMMALMTRLSGVLPGVAYNVSHGLWFALIAGGSFGSAYNITQVAGCRLQVGKSTNQPIGEPEIRDQRSSKTALVVGVIAAVFVVFLGNLEGTLELAHQNGIGSPDSWQWLDIKDISGPATTGGGVKAPRYLWWWRASRVVHDYTLKGDDQEVIDEFPFFSFLNGDLHPHTLAYPFAFLAISLALNVYRGKKQEARGKTQETGGKTRILHLASCILHPAALPWPDLLLYAICLGALGFLNTWDFPIYLFVVVVAFALRRWQEAGTLNNKVITDVIVLGAILGIVGFVLYLPFYISFQSQARGILPNLLNGTRFSQFLVMFGQFAVPGALFLLALAALRSQVSAWRFWLGALGWAFALLLAVTLVGLALGIISPDGRMALQAWRTDQPIPGLGVQDVGTAVTMRLLDRLLDPWTALLLALTVVVIWKLISQSVTRSSSQPVKQSDEESKEVEPLTNPAVPFILLLFLVGAGLALSVEFVYLADTFGTRMNTVFKFYYQVWALWGVAAACAVGMVLDDVALWTPFRVVTSIVAALLVVAGLVYPIMAITTSGDQAHPTLDGTAWIAQQSPDDYAAIEWLNQNVPDSPVILEAPGQSYHAELSRVSAFTGLPAVLGWDYHELQWRGTYDEAGRRKADVEKFYTTRDSQETLTLLDKYAISYVYVGPAERATFPAPSLQKFDTLMDVAFQQGNVTIYKRK